MVVNTPMHRAILISLFNDFFFLKVKSLVGSSESIVSAAEV